MHTADRFTDATRHLVRIAAAVAATSLGAVRRILSDAKPVADPAHVDEVLLQSYLFAGFPRTLNAMVAWRDLAETPAPDADDEAAYTHATEWAERGEAVCRTVYGKAYETLRANVRALHPAIDQWMVVDGYGKVLARPALDLLTRELCIVAACAAAEQTPQLRSHLRGARNCGATHEELALTISALADLVSRDAMTAARDELAKLKEKEA